MNAEEQYDHAGLTISIYQDDSAGNPFEEWDQLGTLTFEHDDIPEIISELGTLYLTVQRTYDGELIARDEPFDEDTDDGIIFCTREQWRANDCAPTGILTKKRRAHLIAVLTGEIKTYNQWVTGDVWGYIISDEGNDHIDSCWGFYDLDYAKEEAEAGATFWAEEQASNERKRLAVFADAIGQWTALA